MTKLVETRKYKSKTLSSIKGCELVFFRDGQETLGERLPSLHSEGNIENINWEASPSRGYLWKYYAL